ncbi:MAG: ATP-grasp domain-containing protein [Pseudomonadales bacterium]
MTVDQQRKNVFLLAYDEFHGRYLERLSMGDRVAFHALLDSNEVVYQQHYDIDGMLDRARQVLDRFDGPVDGIITHWDFPAISMLAILCAERGLPGPSLEAVLQCSHKYWSRLQQRRVAPEHTPAFCAVDPFDHDALDKITLDYPFWVKPVKGYGSALGFRIDNANDFATAMEQAQAKIHRLGDPVNVLLAKVALPDEVRGIDGNHMIAEQMIGGEELAPEGFVQGGYFHAHGIIDVIRGENGKSLEQVRYPSTQPASVTQRCEQVAEAVLRQIGFDDGCFNMEFFWDEPADKLWIVEINPRLSQSHSNLFEKVDGTSNHTVAVQVALGERPEFRHGGGEYQYASKIWYRHYDTTDGVAKRVPKKDDLEALAERQPDTLVEVNLQPGARLSELLDQDAYSYVLAELHIGADSLEELDDKFRQARELLPFEIDRDAPG